MFRSEVAMNAESQQNLTAMNRLHWKPQIRSMRCCSKEVSSWFGRCRDLDSREEILPLLMTKNLGTRSGFQYKRALMAKDLGINGINGPRFNSDLTPSSYRRWGAGLFISCSNFGLNKLNPWQSPFSKSDEAYVYWIPVRENEAQTYLRCWAAMGLSRDDGS